MGSAFAKDILGYEEPSVGILSIGEEEGKGTCKYIYKFVDKTPFGYVFDAPSEGWLSQSSATLRHYQDLGWVVTD